MFMGNPPLMCVKRLFQFDLIEKRGRTIKTEMEKEVLEGLCKLATKHYEGP